MSTNAHRDLGRRLLVALAGQEVDRVMALTDAEVRAEVAAMGEDPSEHAREARARYERLRDGLGLRAIAEGGET